MSRRLGSGFAEAPWQRLVQRLTYVSTDVTKAGGAEPLREALEGFTAPLFYLATSPSLYGAICAALRDAGLAGDESPDAWSEAGVPALPYAAGSWGPAAAAAFIERTGRSWND